MDVREKLVELLREAPYNIFGNKLGNCYFDSCLGLIADHLITNGVTVQDSKVVEIDQFKLPIDDAILILREEHKQRVDGYTTHLSYGGKGDPAEEVHIDALEMAIAALEWEKRQMPQPPKGE